MAHLTAFPAPSITPMIARLNSRVKFASSNLGMDHHPTAQSCTESVSRYGTESRSPLPNPMSAAKHHDSRPCASPRHRVRPKFRRMEPPLSPTATTMMNSMSAPEHSETPDHDRPPPTTLKPSAQMQTLANSVPFHIFYTTPPRRYDQRNPRFPEKDAAGGGGGGGLGGGGPGGGFMDMGNGRRL